MNLTVSAYASLLRDRWRLVAVVTVLGVLAGVAMAMIRDRPVAASVDIHVPVWAIVDVAPGRDAATEGRLLVRKYVELAESAEVAAVVARQQRMTVEEVEFSVDAKSAPDAAMFRLTATNPDPVQAVALANAVALKVVSTGRTDGLRATVAQLVDRPRPWPEVFVSAGAAGGVAGFVLSLFVAGWRDRRR